MSKTQEELKKVLLGADDDEVYSAMIKIGKSFYRELKDDIVPFLQNANVELRSGAIRVLAFYWKLPEYKEIALTLFNNDTDSTVRADALMAWVGYYKNSNDKAVLKKLYDIMINKHEEHEIRAQAYSGLLFVAGLPKENWPDIFVDDVDTDADWNLINQIIQSAE